MAIIDYHSIKSLIFANLTKSSRILIPVLSCLCNDFDGSLSKEHSKHDALAMYAGLATSSVKIALKELHEKGIISIHTTIGHPAAIIYIPAATLPLTSKNLLASRSSATQLADNQLPLYPETPPQTPKDKEPETVGTQVAERTSSNERLKKQTALVPRSLIKTWWRIKGPKFVMSVLSEMEKKNGEIKDPAAYFATCCKKGWVPTSKKAEREAAAEAAREDRTLYEEAQRQRWERHCQSVITEEADPETQARIRTIQETFLETMGEPEVVHNPPA
jgi:hypothetical protein